MPQEITLREAVEFAVNTEELGAVFYNKMAQQFEDDTEIKEIFARLAKDELIHEKQFTALLTELPQDDGLSNQDAGFEYVRAMSMSEFFMGEADLAKDLETIKTRDDALERAFQLEKATLGYYQALKDVLGESKILDAIIQAEKGHLTKVMQYLLTGAKVRGLNDSF